MIMMIIIIIIIIWILNMREDKQLILCYLSPLLVRYWGVSSKAFRSIVRLLTMFLLLLFYSTAVLFIPL
jgi:hypothetical protein